MDQPWEAAAPRPGRDSGRTDDAGTLRRRLTSADEAYLDGASENPQLGDAELALLLRNRRCPPAALARFATDRTSRRQIKRLIVLHPRVPLTPARSLVPYLFWRDLAEVATAAHVNPVLRREAERSLASRVNELAVGEQVALARRAPRRLVDALRTAGEPRVLATLLDNPRTAEADVVAIARDERTPASTLAGTAEHHAWGTRREVRLALARNPNAPVAAAIRAARGLDDADLRPLSNDATVPRIVRVAALRELELRADPGSRRAPGGDRGSARSGTV